MKKEQWGKLLHENKLNEFKSEFKMSIIKETGLLHISNKISDFELAIEDIDEICKYANVNRKKIANRADFS